MSTHPEDDICVRGDCMHRRGDHVRPGLCDGLGSEKGMLGSFCLCPGFKAAQKEGAGGYRPWEPERGPSSHNLRFSRTSGANEIGDGRATVRRSHQDTQLTHVAGKKREAAGDLPEWVMFGIKHEDGTVTIHASTGLTYIKLRQDPTEFDRLHHKLIREGTLTESPWDLSARLVGTTESDADNYVEALKRLMGMGWQNGNAPEPSTADLQRMAALEDAEREDLSTHRALDAPDPDDEIVDAEIVEED